MAQLEIDSMGMPSGSTLSLTALSLVKHVPELVELHAEMAKLQGCI